MTDHTDSGRGRTAADALALMQEMLARAMRAPDEEKATFRVVRVTLSRHMPSTNPPRNKATVDVEVDGIVHEVRIRSREGNVHRPPALKGHPLLERIKVAALVATSLAERGHLKTDLRLDDAPGAGCKLGEV